MTHSVFLPIVQAHAPNTLLVAINIERKAQGLAPLNYDSGLTASAQQWANHLRDTGEWRHADDWAERVISYYPEWRAIGEIIGAGGNVPAIVDAWMESAGHRSIMLSLVFRDAGVGYAAGGHYGEYWVVNFGAKREKHEREYMNNNFDPLTRAIRCEKCGEWWYQGTPHGCKPSSQLDEAVRDRDKRIAELEAQITEGNLTRLLRSDEIDAAAVRSRCEAAMQMVGDLCTGKRNWLISIPARPDYDPDLVIAAALADIPKLLEGYEVDHERTATATATITDTADTAG